MEAYSFGNTAHHDSVKAAAPVRSENNQVRSPFFRFTQNCLIRTILVPGDLGCYLQWRTGQSFFRSLDALLCILERSDAEISQFLNVMCFKIRSIFGQNKLGHT